MEKENLVSSFNTICRHSLIHHQLYWLPSPIESYQGFQTISGFLKSKSITTRTNLYSQGKTRKRRIIGFQTLTSSIRLHLISTVLLKAHESSSATAIAKADRPKDKRDSRLGGSKAMVKSGSKSVGVRTKVSLVSLAADAPSSFATTSLSLFSKTLTR